MYQRNNTKNDNRRSYIMQNQYFTYQRKGNTNELGIMMQTLQQQVNEMQIQINNLSSCGGGGPDIGTMWLNKKYYLYIIRTNMWMRIFVYSN